MIGAKERENGQVAAKPVQSTDSKTLGGFVQDWIETGSTVYTDGASAYGNMDAYDHDAVNHSAREYVRGRAHTNGIESFWSMLKRGYVGTYHKMSIKHLHRYVNEFAGRHNIRDLDTVKQMSVIARWMVGRRLRYEDLIEDVGLPSGARG